MNLLVYIKPAIQYANAILMTIKEMLKSLALLKETTEDIDYETEFAFFGDSVSETTDQVEELVQAMTTLLGFDTLNILGDTSTNASIEGLSVEGRILDALKEYNMNLDEVTFKAREVSESLLTWLGYVKVLNEETGEYNWILGEGYTNIEKIKDVALGLITFIATSTIFTKIATLVTKIGSISSILSTIVGTIGGISVVVGTLALGFKQIYDNVESFRTSINNSLSNIKTNLSTIWEFLSQGVYPFLKPALDVIWNVIKEIGAMIGNNFIKAFETLTELLTGDFVGAWEVIKQWIIDIDNSLGRVFGEDNWNNFKLTIQNIFNSIKDWLKNSWFGDMLNWFKSLFNEIGRIFNEYVIPLFKGTFELIGTFYEERIKPALDVMKIGFEMIYNFVKEKLQPVIENIGLAIENSFLTIKNGFKGFINWIIEGINKIIRGLNKISFEFPEWIPGIGGNTFGINIPEIPALATGGVIQQPTMALMGEYTNAKSNPEIVTPENLMRQVFVESMLPIAQAIISGDREVVNAIGELANRPIELNGRKVSENIYDDMNKVAIRKTGRPLGYVG